MFDPFIKKYISCTNCKQEYKTTRWWFTNSKLCLFCTHYLPMRDTKLNILQQINHHYYMSGEYTITNYYKEYLDNVNKWCEKWHIQTTRQELALEKMLRAEKNWTRDYWY